MKKLFLSLLVVLALTTQVHALGIMPARTYLEYDVNEVYYSNLTIYNNENRDSYLEVTTSGSLKNYIFPEKTKLKFEKNQSYLYLNFEFKNPSYLNPGVYKGKIRITEMVKDQENKIIGSLAVTHTIFLEVKEGGGVEFTGEAKAINLTKIPHIIPFLLIPEKIKTSSNSNFIISMLNFSLIIMILFLLVFIIFVVRKSVFRERQAKQCITKALDDGYTEQQIRAAAEKSGWSDGLISKILRKERFK